MHTVLHEQNGHSDAFYSFNEYWEDILDTNEIIVNRNVSANNTYRFSN